MACEHSWSFVKLTDTRENYVENDVAKQRIVPQKAISVCILCGLLKEVLTKDTE